MEASPETAKEHIVVQSTVSSRIQELEKELGQSLFIRSYNHAELTLAGQAFLELCKKHSGIREQSN